MQRPIKREVSQSTSDESGSSFKKTKPLHEKNFRHSITQNIHTSILHAISAGKLEENWIKNFSEFKASLNSALITPNQAQYVTALSINNASLLIDILRLPYVKNGETPPNFFSRFCETKTQADNRCQLLLEFMLQATMKKPMVFEQLIFASYKGKSTLHCVIKTGNVKVVETYLKCLTEAIKQRALSPQAVLNGLILACDNNKNNIFHYANEGNHIEIMTALVNFINENYNDKDCASNILDNLFSSVKPQSQQVDYIKNECLSQTAAAKITAQQLETAMLRQALEEERARSVSLTANYAALFQQAQTLSGYSQETYNRLNFEVANRQKEKAFSNLVQSEAEALRSDVAALRQELTQERQLLKSAEDQMLTVQGTCWQLQQQLNDELAERGRLQVHFRSSQRELDQARIEIRDRVKQVVSLEHEANELRTRLSKAECALKEAQQRRDRYEERPSHYGRLHTKTSGLYPVYKDSPSPRRGDS